MVNFYRHPKGKINSDYYFKISPKKTCTRIKRKAYTVSIPFPSLSFLFDFNGGATEQHKGLTASHEKEERKEMEKLAPRHLNNS